MLVSNFQEIRHVFSEFLRKENGTQRVLRERNGVKSLTTMVLMLMITVVIMQNWTFSVNFDKKHHLMVPSTKSFTCLDLNSEKIICELFYIHVE